MQLDERQGAVSSKNGQARRPEAATGDRRGLTADGGEHRLARRGWAATVGVVEAGPQALAHSVEGADEVASALEPLVERIVELLQLPLGVVLDALELAAALWVSFVSPEGLERRGVGRGHGMDSPLSSESGH